MSNSTRIAWADTFKALCMILVVIGHATGRFNTVIYQFHVAAFFWISGFLAQNDKKELSEVIISRFFSLCVPYMFFATVGLSGFAILQHFDLLKYVSSFGTIPDWKWNVLHMNEALYCDWLGATWFLNALFAAHIISKLSLKIDGNKTGIVFLLSSVFLFQMGYYIKRSGQNPFHIAGMVQFFVAQFYFCLGHLCRRVGERLDLAFHFSVHNVILIGIAVINACGFYFIKNKQIVMDIVSVSINSPLIDFLAVANGVSFLLCISLLVERLCPIGGVKKLFARVGKNTMGILVFHFVGFKLVTIALSVFGIGQMQDVVNLCPVAEISYHWWPLYSLVSICFSLLIWKMLRRFKLFRVLAGLERDLYGRVYKKYLGFVEEDK